MSTHRVPFDVCYSDMTARIVTRWKVILWKVGGGGGGGEWVMKDKIFLHHEYLYCFTSLL